MLTKCPPAFRRAEHGSHASKDPGELRLPLEVLLDRRQSAVVAQPRKPALPERVLAVFRAGLPATLAVGLVTGAGMIANAYLDSLGGPSALVSGVAEGRAAMSALLPRDLEPVDSIQLDESPSVINVSPRVKPDPLGGFLVADADESQIRRYSVAGDLLTAFGRKGRGPGEFERLSAVVRTYREQLLAIEMGGRLSMFDSVGGRLLRTWNVPLAPVYGAAAVRGDTLVVLTGRRGGSMGGELVHLLDPRSGSLQRSLFSMPKAPPGMEATYAFAGTADVAVRQDTIAAVFALADSVFLFTADGERLPSVPIPFRHFRPLREPVPLRGSIGDYRRWGSHFSAISRVYWTDRGFLIQYYDTDGAQPQWRLLGMTREGGWLFEETRSPELLTVSEAGSSLYFVEPSSLTPNRWVEARVKP